MKRLFEIVGSLDASLSVFELTSLDFQVCTPGMIKNGDEIELNQSHYYVEAKRWRWLLLVDEVLSGTNSSDRNRTVTAILSDLSESDSFIIVTN